MEQPILMPNVLIHWQKISVPDVDVENNLDIREW